MPPELMPSPPAPKPFALWFRSGRGVRWTRLHAGTEKECTARMFDFQESYKHGGDWAVTDQDPNARRR
jgi:hypothetical protein